MERVGHSTISLGDEIKIRKYDELNSTFHKNIPMESYDINAKHLQELFDLSNEWIKENEELKKHYIELKKEYINQEEKVQKALDLIKQKRENAVKDLQLKTLKKHPIDKLRLLKAEIDTYTDCIITIETEMGRK